MAPGTEGGWTTHVPSGEKMFIYDASVRYQAEGTGLLIIAGKEYGSGSSRDWAAKGTLLLGVRAVLAESFERIHRSNLVGMGVLPLQFLPGENRETLALTGSEVYSIEGVKQAIESGQRARVRAGEKSFEVVVRIDTPMEAGYYRNGGILPYVLRQLAGNERG
jgi:aconitate hydratase